MENSSFATERLPEVLHADIVTNMETDRRIARLNFTPDEYLPGGMARPLRRCSWSAALWPRAVTGVRQGAFSASMSSLPASRAPAKCPRLEASVWRRRNSPPALHRSGGASNPHGPRAPATGKLCKAACAWAPTADHRSPERCAGSCRARPGRHRSRPAP